MKIFFSYGHDHYTEFIQKIRQDLINNYNLNVWIDSIELRAGIDWQKHIEKGIEESDKIIYFMTPHSARRDDGYCLNELAYSCIFKKPITPIMVDYVVPPLSIARIQYLDIQSIKDNQDELRYKEFLENLVAIIKNEKELNFESDQFDLLNYLDPLDFSHDISKHLKGFVGRKWLYKKVDDLLENDESRVLWITAEAGFGKTSFSTYLTHKHKRTIGIHYCKYDNPRRKDPVNVLTSLIYQISTQIPEYKDNLKSDKEKLADLKSLDKMDIVDQLLIQPLNKIESIKENYFFIIDALDESEEKGKNHLADLIPKFDDLPSWLKIVVTSRPEPYLKRKLSMLKTIELDAQSEQNLDDLREYIKSHEDNKNCEILKDTDIQTTLIEKSEGNILYLKEIIASIIKGDIKQGEITDLPRGMTGLYVNMFERYFPEVDDYEENIMPIFELLCAANQPLSKDLISDILDTNKRDFKKNLGLIGSLIEKNENDEIYFYHKSLSDWLIDEDLCSDDYFVDIDLQYYERLIQKLQKLIIEYEKNNSPYIINCGVFHFNFIIQYQLKYEYELISILESIDYSNFMLSLNIEYLIDLFKNLYEKSYKFVVTEVQYFLILSLQESGMIKEANFLKESVLEYLEQLYLNDADRWAEVYYTTLEFFATNYNEYSLESYVCGYSLESDDDYPNKDVYQESLYNEIEQLEKSLELVKNRYIGNPSLWLSRYIQNLNRLANLYEEINQLKEALLLQKTVVEILEKLYQENNRWEGEYLRSLTRLRNLYCSLNQSEFATQIDSVIESISEIDFEIPF